MGKITGRCVFCGLVAFHNAIAPAAVRLKQAVMRKPAYIFFLRADFEDSFPAHAF